MIADEDDDDDEEENDGPPGAAVVDDDELVAEEEEEIPFIMNDVSGAARSSYTIHSIPIHRMEFP
jgi:hypothetical protein